MTRESRERTARFVDWLYRQPRNADGTAYRTIQDAEQFRRIGRSLSRLNERECNEPMTDAQQQRADKRWDRLAAEAAAIAERYGLVCKAQGDPRGYALSLYTPNQNTESETGYGVPEEM